MATPRKHWFRTYDSILHEGWPDAVLATLTRLSAYLNTRRARECRNPVESCEAVLSPAALMLVTGRQRLGAARSVLGQCAGAVTLTVCYRGGDTLVRWPKWPELQGHGARDFPESRPRVARESPLPSPSPSPTPTSPRTRTSPENKKSPDKPATRSQPAWALELSELLIENVQRVPGGRIPPRARSTWAAEIARMPAEIPGLTANGKLPEAHIEAGLRWAFGPENLGCEYEVVIRSGKGLREKWPKLVEAAKRKARQPDERKQREDWERWAETGEVT